MSLCLYVIFVVVGFNASVAGVICEIDGGVLARPILDAFGVLSVVSISLLPDCTVLSMSCYSVGKVRLSGESLVDSKTGVPSAIDTVIGRMTGKMMFQVLSNMSSDKDKVGAIQAVCLLLITFGITLYILKKDRIHIHHITNPLACILISPVPGTYSSFLGTGGGPINLVVLFFSFSMDTKTAVQNSPYIILFSQIANLTNTLVTGTVSQFSFILLVLMMAYGILDGVAGRVVNKKIDTKIVNELFIGLMVITMLVYVYNVCQFM